MITSWEPRQLPTPQLPGCGAARRVLLPDEEKWRADDEWRSEEESRSEEERRSEDLADDTCGGGAEEGPTDADTADPLAPAGSFSRLLLRLAAEHRRALTKLRAELETKVASSPDCDTNAQNEEVSCSPVSTSKPQSEKEVAIHRTVAETAELGEPAVLRISSMLSMASSASSPGWNRQWSPASERREPRSSRRESPTGPLDRVRRANRRTLSITAARSPTAPARRRRRSIVRTTATSRLSPFDFVSEDEDDQRRRPSGSRHSSGAVREVQTETPQASGSETSSRGCIRFEVKPFPSRASSVELGNTFKRCVQSQAFDTLSGALIILNSVMLGWAANTSVENSQRGTAPDEMPESFKVMTVAFTCWFAVELFMRACVAGPRKFFSNEDWTWNVFDSVTVSTDIIHSLLELAKITFDDGNAAMQNLTVVRMLRIMRITRAIRMVRLIRFFRELRMMVFSVLRSGSSLLWSLLMLITTIYIFGIYFVQVVAYHLYITEAPPEETPEFVVYKTTKEMFGSLLRSVYTLYLAVSGGISWGEIGSVLIHIAPIHGFVLCFFTFFTTFALLNIITGIFVDSSINSAQSNKDEVIQEQLHQQNSALTEMKKLFQLADKDRSGTMDLEEFEQHLQSKEVRAHFLSLGIEVDKVKGLFRLLDLDMSGELSLEEFVLGCTRLKGPAKSIDLATLMNEYMRMSDDWQRFFTWSDAQFTRLYRFQERLEKQLEGLLTDTA